MMGVSRLVSNPKNISGVEAVRRTADVSCMNALQKAFEGRILHINWVWKWGEMHDATMEIYEEGVYVSDRCQKIEITGATCRHADGSRADGIGVTHLPFPAVSFHKDLPAIDHSEMTSDCNGLSELFLTDYCKALSSACNRDFDFHLVVCISIMEARSGFNSTSSAKWLKKQSTYFLENKYSVINKHRELASSTLLKSKSLAAKVNTLFELPNSLSLTAA